MALDTEIGVISIINTCILTGLHNMNIANMLPFASVCSFLFRISILINDNGKTNYI